jgi:hypothetical protein
LNLLPTFQTKPDTAADGYLTALKAVNRPRLKAAVTDDRSRLLSDDEDDDDDVENDENYKVVSSFGKVGYFLCGWGWRWGW